MGMSAPSAEAIIRGPSVHRESSRAIPGPYWAMRPGSSTNDSRGLEGRCARTVDRPIRDSNPKVGGRRPPPCGVRDRGGRVSGGTRTTSIPGTWFLALDLGRSLVLSVGLCPGCPYWGFSSGGPASMVLFI